MFLGIQCNQVKESHEKDVNRLRKKDEDKLRSIPESCYDLYFMVLRHLQVPAAYFTQLLFPKACQIRGRGQTV